MLALGKILSCLACVLLVVALAARDPVQCTVAEKHNANNNSNNNNNKVHAAVSVANTVAPIPAKVSAHLTTGTPQRAAHAIAASAAPIVHHDKSKVASVSMLTTIAPAANQVAAGATVAHSSAHASVTGAPAGHLNAAHAAAPAVKAPAPAVAAAHVGVPQRLAAYFGPICQQVDKLEPKQMFKIQAQMKQFIEKTAGKMSLCFMQHYSIDPNLTPVNKLQLGAICSSRPLGIGVKGSFKNFQACAEQNWDKNLDAELERINRMCENCAAHPHQAAAVDAAAAASVAATTLKAGHLTTVKPAVSAHEQQNVKEATMISDVMSKVFDNNKGALNRTDIKMIDVGPKSSAIAGAKASVNQMPSKEVLNDPNTMVVFVDEPAKKGPTSQGVAAKSTPAVANHAAAAIAAAPAKHAPLAGLLPTLAPKPLVNAAAKASVAAATTVKPAAAGGLPNKSVVHAKSTEAPAPLGGIKPTSISVETNGRSGLGDKILSAVSKIEKLGKDSTTAKPANGKSATTKTGAPKNGGSTTKKPSGAPKAGPSTGKPKTTAKAKTAAASAAPSKSSASKSSTSRASTKKPAASGSTTAPAGKSKSGGPPPQAKGKVETDAKNAIKALQLQRAQQTHGASDAHLHQIEHQRQMAIDPIGHTIKHQQYEQRKAAAAASAALAG